MAYDMIIEFGKPENKKQWERRFDRFLNNLGVDDPVYIRKQLTFDDISFEMLLDVRGKLEGDLIFYGYYEPHIQKLFKQLGVNKGIILDIGANIGLHSLYLSHAFSQAKIFSFEASPRVFKDLNLNKSLNGCANLEVLNLALGDRPGEMSFYEPSGKKIENRGLGSFNHDNVPADFSEVVLQIATVDSVIEERLEPDEKVTMIKIDVQGHEGPVLQGAITCLTEHRPVVFMELEMENFKEPMKVLEDFKKMFESLDYSAQRISDTEAAYTALDWSTVGSTDKFDALFIPA